MRNQLWQQQWPAPAKLNLMLRIVGRREDGYHQLQTVFQLIDFCDWLYFESLKEDRVRLTAPIAGVDEADDLTVRAALLLKNETGFSGGVSITIDKKIPMGGGLGGGSSDAATTLVALNALWELGLSGQRLSELGLKLGADVPVFIRGCNAWAEGVGEKLQPISLADSWYVIVKPQCHVATKAVFCAKDLTRDSKTITISDFQSGQHQNDCLETVREAYPVVDKVLVMLSSFGEARLTGTGACVFLQFASENSAKAVYEELKSGAEDVYFAAGVERSPVYQKLDYPSF
ncbi:MAG TPA: 4-(cytidine 5'-diphospho)-2-C-methyl-D-erythritol kinase [Methylococcaceae bacterium]|jgi:4-diphosphocytidyl-2-C-methyl-D-erythritol kinase|nr:4-(cytidine 5'-diphospho)-2-C-methyl-D-erythritol kinase [Methylococcaceae bacterium]